MLRRTFPRDRGADRWVLLALAVIVPAWRVAWGFLGQPMHLAVSFEDDMYYYALIAQNLAHGRGSTFGGLVPTNGYQPLWELMLVPLAWVADGDAFLRLVYLLIAVLFAVAVVTMWAVARRLGARSAFGYAAVYATTVGLLAGDAFFSGMEIAVVVPALLVFAWAALGRLSGAAPSTPLRTGVVLGALALVVSMGRLDALAFPVAFGALTLLHADRAVRRGIGIAGMVLGCGVLAYALVNVVLFGTPVPVSGQAKAVGGGRMGLSLVTDYLAQGTLGPLAPALLGAQALLVSAVALVLLRRARERAPLFTAAADTVMRDLLLACLVGQAAQLAFYTATSSYAFWDWYFYYVPVQMFLAGMVIARVLLASPARRVLASSAVMVTVALAGCVVDVRASLVDVGKPSWTTATPAVAAWVTGNTAPTDVIGIGDRAGYFTWLTRRPTVQLEGLVQDEAYLRYLEQGRVPDYMTKAGVRWYVRSEEPAKGLVPSPSSCTGAVEPVQGRGPKSYVPVCPDDLVYRDVGSDYVWSVWRYRGGGR